MRCHLAPFAEHGYIVVAPNPTGRTGYGNEFTNAIQGSWAGELYSDLQRGLDYICQSLKYVDTERAVALGLGYGGHMSFEATLLLFLDEDHHIRSPEILLLWYRTVVDWLKQQKGQDA
ncbi:dipeptidyl aminopeptidases-like protein [Penicillium desertorum]|uniref:Dipeptidyl-peptidase V n=1 Tax=Penicillium desertorum TaxID=1303715 RepID=A0A9W9WRU4_9EURO|nr:dipeptidyl aminopeptidases-like protein [Penicillium desertorum]